MICSPKPGDLPSWVPEDAQRYLRHTETGQSIRDLAREAGCYASTILRQVRKLESRRDDPLVDAALSALAVTCFGSQTGVCINNKDTQTMTTKAIAQVDLPESTELNREAVRILRRLCENGAVLAVAENMDKAVVVRDDGVGSNTRTAVVDSEIAQAMALKEWITCPNPGRISRYYITASGRTALSRMVADQENGMRARQEGGFAEAPTAFSTHSGDWGQSDEDEADGQRPRRVRYNMAESPLVALARRRDRDGQPFLDDELVRAGERLREDFELAQMGPRVGQNWERFLTGGGSGEFQPDGEVGRGPAAARDRVAKALADLGPGLADVALRCCCFLEGLENAEKRLGWSARSGKIVLRIALQRLKRHYGGQAAPDRLIG